MTTFLSITLYCSICQRSFKSNGVGSCGYASKRTDFRQNYWGFNPIEYFYHLCPHCGFCAPKKMFEHKIDNSIREKLKEFGILEDKSLSKKLERAMLCLETLNELGVINKDEFALANIFLDAYWWGDDQDNTKKFGEKILDFFEKAFDKGQIPSDQFYTILYLMGEINRRIGNIDKAKKIFDEVISLTKNRKELDFIRKLAIQQRNDPKEEL